MNTLTKTSRTSVTSALRRPLRLWMTSSLAVVMAAFVPARVLAESHSPESLQDVERLMRHSRYGVAETLQRIEAAAQSQGLSVLMRMGGKQPVIVLASSVGGTLVVMDEASARIDIPLALWLRESADGGVDVATGASCQMIQAGLHDLPQQWPTTWQLCRFCSIARWFDARALNPAQHPAQGAERDQPHRADPRGEHHRHGHRHQAERAPPVCRLLDVGPCEDEAGRE